MLTVGSPRISWARVRLAHVLSRVGMLAFAASAVVTLLPGGMSHGPWGHNLPAVALSLASLVTFVASFFVWFARLSLPGQIEIDCYDVRVRHGGTHEVSVGDRIESAYYVSRYVRGSGRIISGGRRAPTVEVVLHGGDVVAIEVASADEAREVIRQLGFGPGQRRVTMALGSPMRRLYHLLLGLAAYYVGAVVAAPFRMFSESAQQTAATIIMPLAMFAAYFALKTLIREPELVVGSDGVLVRAGRKQRFLRASAIRGVEQASIAVPVLVHTTDQGIPEVIDGKALDLERRGAVATLLHERFLQTAAPPSSSRDVTAQGFARRDRPVAEWRHDLAGRTKAANYRAAATPEDSAAEVLVSGRAADDERAGAALALRIGGEPPERIRIAASGVADQHLRETLEAIAEEENEEALDKMLGRLQQRRR